MYNATLKYIGKCLLGTFHLMCVTSIRSSTSCPLNVIIIIIIVLIGCMPRLNTQTNAIDENYAQMTRRENQAVIIVIAITFQGIHTNKSQKLARSMHFCSKINKNSISQIIHLVLGRSATDKIDHEFALRVSNRSIYQHLYACGRYIFDAANNNKR